MQLLFGLFSLKITSFEVIRGVHLKWDTLYTHKYEIYELISVTYKCIYI